MVDVKPKDAIFARDVWATKILDAGDRPFPTFLTSSYVGYREDLSLIARCQDYSNKL